jgi:amino acid transporter
MSHSAPEHQHKLDQFSATAIASNDILSSCLYVSGIAIMFAGVYAPLVFLAIGFVLWCYKKVYTEVVEALPLNGGAYNCLLNATDKNKAAIAGVMTVLSYIATSVISAKTASEYIHTVFAGVPVIPLTIAIIFFFAVLTAVGVKDSAKVAKFIFALNLFTLTLFISVGIISLINNGWGYLAINWHATQELFKQQPPWKMLFLAFSASLLGVSGFESSANFVEEQQPHVFRKTLKNMLAGVVLFNPLIALIVLFSLDLSSIAHATDFVLAEAAFSLSGKALQWLVVANAFMVLSGAVLASFVGATGLLYRMTLDHCFPSSLLLPKLRQRNTNTQRLIFLFAGLCISILLMTKGNLLSLAGVYTISFLGVMTFFALGNLILRRNRSDLKRTYWAPIPITILAAIATSLGIIGNIMINPQNLIYFLTYFLPALLLVIAMIYRDYILEWLDKSLSSIKVLKKLVDPLFEHVINSRIILFAHEPGKLFRSLEYIRRNETSRRITIVFCRKKAENAQHKIDRFHDYIHWFKEANIYPQFDLTLMVEDDLEFGAETIKTYANRFKIGRNNVFIGTIHKEHDVNFEDLGGVRIIQ